MKLLKKKKTPLSRSLSRWLFLILVTVFLTTAYIAYEREDTGYNKIATADTIAGVVRMIDATAENLNIFLADSAGQWTAKAEQDTFIKEYPADDVHIYCTDKDGNILRTNLAAHSGKNIKNLETIASRLEQMEQSGAAYSSPSPYHPIPDFSGDERYYFYILPMQDGSGYAAVGYTEAYYRKKLALLLPNAAKTITITNGFFAVLDSECRIISIPNSKYIDEPERLSTLIDLYRNPETAKKEMKTTFGQSTEEETVPVLYDHTFFDSDEEWKDWSGMSVFSDFYYAMTELCDYYFFYIYPTSDTNYTYLTFFYVLVIEAIIIVTLFICVRLLVYLLVVRRFKKVNAALEEITDGNLDVQVEVRKTREFDGLSTGINLMVDRLKGYIAEAAARYDADLAIAKEIQCSALPRIFPPYPDRKEFDLYATMNAAKEVGGDFYDFFMLDDKTLGFLIADVSGKSIPGAMFMMRAKSVIKSLAESALPANEVFIQANDSLCENNEAEMFVTAWMGYLELDTGLVHIANAGHNPPLLLHNGNAEYLVLKPGLMLGEIECIHYKEHTLQMEPGDMLFLYTDGVTEAMNPENKLYGEERLKKLLSVPANTLPENKFGAVGAICEMTAKDIAVFANGAEQSDDITMLCLQYKGKNSEKQHDN